jgi:rubrerythrin
MINYDCSKVLQAVIKTEQHVSEMYRIFSQQVKDPSVKNLFLKMSQDEIRHKDMYSSILNSLNENTFVEIPYEEAEYTDLLLSSNIFVNELVRDRYKKSDALNLAEKIEKDSILFYTQIQKLLPDIPKEDIDLIINEEKKHLKYVLETQKNSFIFALTI